MSLINDALKRAKESNKNLPQQAAVGSPMEPVQHVDKPRLPLFVGCIIFVFCIVAGVMLWKMSQAQSPAQRVAETPKVAAPEKKAKVQTPTHQQPRSNSLVATAKSLPTSSVMTIKVATNAVSKPARMVASTNAVPAAAPVVTAKAAPAPKALAAVVPAPQPVVTQAPATRLPEVKPSVPPMAPRPAPPVAAKSNGPFPDLKLKAIIYRASRPVAIINNASLTLGDEISGARLIRIEPRKVTLKWNNQTRDLSLE